MEQTDAALGIGQDDVFDLGNAERGMKKRGALAKYVGNKDEADTDSDEDESNEDEDADVVDSEEEKERKIAGLEAELDGLYDAYKERMTERDAKFKAQEARLKNKHREEWSGIGQKGSDDDDSDGEEGGWERMAEVKGADDDSSTDDDSDEEEVMTPGKKRKRIGPSTLKVISKKTRLVTKLDDPKTSLATQLWFGQDVFAGVDGLDNIEEDEDAMDEDEEESVDAQEWKDAVSSLIFLHVYVCHSSYMF